MDTPNGPVKVNLFRRIIKISWPRLTESRQTITYTSLIIFTTLLSIVLESLVANAHVRAAMDVMRSYLETGNDPSSSNSALSPSSSLQSDDPFLYVLLSLRRLKDENVFFILFSLFQLYLGIDAIIRQNVMQIMAHAFNMFLSVVFALVQIGETIKWRSIVRDADNREHVQTSESFFDVAMRIEAGISAALGVLTMIFIYFCWKLLRQFGWNNYKRLGADVKKQARFRIAQVFLLTLKLDAFFHLVFSIFWCVVMSQENYMHSTPAALAWYICHIILTVVQIPALLLARRGVVREDAQCMVLFLVVQALIGVDFIIVLEQSANSWVFWVLAVCLAIILSTATIVLAILVTRNFGTGLQPHVQRMFAESYELQSEEANNRPDKTSSWVIDDFEETLAMHGNANHNNNTPTNNVLRPAA